MTVPAAPVELGGARILFAMDDNAGTNRANILRGYKRTTMNSEGVADLGVYPTSGNLQHGNRNAVNTSQLQLSTTSIPCQGLIVKLRDDSVNPVWVGKTGLTAGTTESTGGYKLNPGESVGVPCRNVNEVYLRWAAFTSGDGVEWLASAD